MTGRLHKGWLCGLIWSIGVLWHPAAVLGDPPTLSRLFPAGGSTGLETVVTVTGKYDSKSVYVWSDRSELQWRQGEKDNQFLVSIPEDSAPGVALVRLVDQHGASQLHRFVVGSLPEANEVEPNDRLSQANVCEELPIVLNGVLEKAGDVDQFRVSLRAEQTLVAHVDAANLLKSPVDISLQIVTPQGHVLAQNLDYAGQDPLLIWRSHRDQDVIVRVFGYPAVPTSAIGFSGSANHLYRLTLTTETFIIGSNPLAVSSRIDTPVTMVGWNLPAERLQTVTAESLASDPLPLVHVFHRSAFAGFVNLPIVSTDLVSQSGPQREPTRVNPPVIVTGQLKEPGQRDQFILSGKKGESWALLTESRSLGYPTDLVLEIEAIASGKRLVRQDDTQQSPDPRVQWKVPEDGEYQISLFDLHGFYGDDYLYRMTIQPTQPGYEVSVSSDSFRGSVGEALELKININRLNGYKETLVAELQEPLPGVQLESQQSVSEGETAKELKLTLIAQQPVNAPFRLIVRPQTKASETEPVEQDDPADDLQQPATAISQVVTASDPQTADLWLFFDESGQ